MDVEAREVVSALMVLGWVETEVMARFWGRLDAISSQSRKKML